MTYNSVQHLLNNRRYIGEYVYREIVVPDGIPAIVPLDLFERVQEKMAKNKKAPARHKAPVCQAHDKKYIEKAEITNYLPIDLVSLRFLHLRIVSTQIA